MSHAIELIKGGTMTCPLCRKGFKIDPKKIRVISETNYVGGHVCNTQELFTCPNCNKRILTKQILRLHAGFGIIPSKESIIEGVKKLKNEYPNVWFRDIVKGKVIYDDTKIHQKYFDEAESEGYAVISPYIDYECPNCKGVTTMRKSSRILVFDFVKSWLYKLYNKDERGYNPRDYRCYKQFYFTCSKCNKAVIMRRSPLYLFLDSKRNKDVVQELINKLKNAYKEFKTIKLRVKIGRRIIYDDTGIKDEYFEKLKNEPYVVIK